MKAGDSPADIAYQTTTDITPTENEDGRDLDPQPLVSVLTSLPLEQEQDPGNEEGEATSQGFDDVDLDQDSYYWDAATMAPLNAASAAAVARLRAFRPPPFPVWDKLPLSRRAAVLLLLYPDRRGDLRVVITMRAVTLRSFSGHAALPGGKADSLDESPYQIARREAWEEIGLPMDDTKLPTPFRIERLCTLPCHLARTELVVRPCVAFLYPSTTWEDRGNEATTMTRAPTVDESLIPRLDPKEVAAVFSAPFHNFLRATDEPILDPSRGRGHADGVWYEGQWTHWHKRSWRMHMFYVPVDERRVTRPRVRDGGLAAIGEDEDDHVDGDGDSGRSTDEKVEHVSRYKVWGMTARILVDAAKVAYGEEPEFEHNTYSGDEELIEELFKSGRLAEKRSAGASAVKELKGGAGNLSKI